MARITDLTTTARPMPRQIGPATLPALRRTEVREQALAEFGQTITTSFDEIYRTQKIEEERINTLRTQDQLTKLNNEVLNLSVGDEGYSRLKGEQAVKRPILTEYVNRFDDVSQRLNGELSNDQQREKFKPFMDAAKLRYQEGILRHVATERETYGKEVFKGIVDGETQNAVVNWNSPNDLGVSLLRVRDAVEEQAETDSWPKKYKDLVLQQAQSKIHGAVVEQAVAHGNYRYAQQWFDHYREEIDGTTAKQLAVAVENGTQKELTNTYNAQYLAIEDNGPALEELRKHVLSDQTLDEGRRNIIVGRIQNRQFVLERRDEIENTRRLHILEKGVNELNANTLAGFEATPEQLGPLLEQSKDTELEPQVQAAVQLASATRVFRNAGPLQQERMLTEAETSMREDPTKFDRNVLNAWRQIHDAQRKQVTEDPVNFATRQGSIPVPIPVDLSQPEQAADALNDRFAVARAVAARYNAPFKPLTHEEVAVLRSALEQGSPEQKRDYLGKLARATAKDAPGYMALMGQIAPDDPVTAIAGAKAGQQDDRAAVFMLRGQAILHPPTKADGKPDTGGLLPMPPENDMRADFDSIVRDALTASPQTRSAHYQAAKAVYAALSADAGDKDTKVLNRDRWEQAITMSVGQIEKYNGRRMVLPHGYDSDQFSDRIKEMVHSVADGSKEAAIRVGQFQKLNDEQRRAQLQIMQDRNIYALSPAWTAGRLLDLPLENVGDNRYVFRSGDGAVSDVFGRPVVIDLSGPKPAKREMQASPTKRAMQEAGSLTQYAP